LRIADDSSDFELSAAPPQGSSDFNLAASDEGTVVLQPDGSDDDFSLELADETALADEPGGALTGPTSGISLSNPVDAGISLEAADDSSDSVDFDLSLEAEEPTPKPAQMKAAADDEGSSEFELSLELDDGGAADAGGDSSEFELTLDDSGSDLEPAGQAKVSGEADIFESDFEIPALSDDGEAATVDTELESSDFDIALDDSELAAEEESGSQVVALDEEEIEPLSSGEVATVGEDEVAEIDEEAVAAAEEEDDEEHVREVVKVIRPAPWGALPTVIMLPAVIVMLLVGFMGFELVQSSAGYRPPGFMSKTLGEMIGMEFPKR
jgi:hypothetical protein